MKKVVLSDAELISKYERGSEVAFAEILKRYKSKVYTTAYLIVKNREVAEDIAQDTFVKLIDTVRKGKYNEEGKFLPWLLRITHNLCIDHVRRESKLPIQKQTGEDEGLGIENSIWFSTKNIESEKIAKDNKKLLRSLIKQLPFEQRQVLLMRHFADMSFKEIADFTDVSINTALGRMRYALINLRKLLNERKIAYDHNFYAE
ncbi:MAG: sigma-70 family RNA polymerase sigma factor [Cytophagales bacterium]